MWPEFKVVSAVSICDVTEQRTVGNAFSTGTPELIWIVK
jgi:hypothetical protein